MTIVGRKRIDQPDRAATRLARTLRAAVGHTDRSEALDAAFLRRAIDVAPDGMVVADPDGVIRFANPAAVRMFGATTLEGRTVEDLLPERLADLHRAHRADYSAAPRPRAMGASLDLRGRRSSGDEFPVEVALSPVETDLGTYVVAIVRDVTERRAVADELMVADRKSTRLNSSH